MTFDSRWSNLTKLEFDGPDGMYHWFLVDNIVVSTEQPDLTVALDTLPNQVQTAGSFPLSATVANSGEGDAPASRVGYYLSTDQALDPSDVAIGTAATPALAAHSPSPTVNGTVTIPTGTKPGKYYVIAKADALDAVAETNEDNNASAPVQIQVGGGMIQGYVVDAGGSPLHGVKVSVQGKEAFTDYDDRSSTLDGTPDGSFRIKLDSVASSPVTLTIHAETMDGIAVPDKTVTVDPSEFSQDGTADLHSISLDTFKVVNAGKIYLLKDQANAANSDVLKRRSAGDPLTQYRRYQQEVKAVKLKLASLGFRSDAASGLPPGSGAMPLDYSTGLWGETPDETPQERATKLFQTLWFVGPFPDATFDDAFGVGNGSGKVTGEVDADTLQALNTAHGVIWTRNLGGSLGGGFANPFQYKDATVQPWMTATVVKGLAALGPKYPVAGPHTITDATKGNGGADLDANGNPKHATHSIGMAFDTRFLGTKGEVQGQFYRPLYGLTSAQKITNDATGMVVASEEYSKQQRDADAVALRKTHPSWKPAQAQQQAEKNAAAKGKRWIVSDNYDRAKTKQLLQTMLALPGHRQVIFNDPGIVLAGLTRAAGHHNHIHLSFIFDKSAYLPAGTDGAPDFSTLSPALNQ